MWINLDSLRLTMGLIHDASTEVTCSPSRPKKKRIQQWLGEQSVHAGVKMSTERVYRHAQIQSLVETGQQFLDRLHPPGLSRIGCQLSPSPTQSVKNPPGDGVTS